jgi:hypothetical protein
MRTRHLVLIIPLLALALDADQLGLTLVVHNEGRQVSTSCTSGVEPLGVLLDVQTPLPVMAVDDGGALVVLELLLLVVPELLPGGAVVLGGGDSRLEIDSAHVHNMDRILLFERRVGHKTGVDGDESAEFGHAADAQDDGALLKIYEVFLGKLLGQL